MFRILITSILILVTQFTFSQKLKWGIVANVGINENITEVKLINSKKYYDFKPLFLCEFNGDIRYRVIKNFSISMQPGFIKKSVKIYSYEYQKPFILSHHQYYFTIPVNLEYAFYKKLNIFVGFEPSFLIKVHNDIQQWAIDSFNSLPMHKMYSTELNIDFGFSYSPIYQTSIGLKYRRALDITSSFYGLQINNIYIQNHSLSLFIRYILYPPRMRNKNAIR